MFRDLTHRCHPKEEDRPFWIWIRHKSFDNNFVYIHRWEWYKCLDEFKLSIIYVRFILLLLLVSFNNVYFSQYFGQYSSTYFFLQYCILSVFSISPLTFWRYILFLLVNLLYILLYFVLRMPFSGLTIIIVLWFINNNCSLVC